MEWRERGINNKGLAGVSNFEERKFFFLLSVLNSNRSRIVVRFSFFFFFFFFFFLVRMEEVGSKILQSSV